MGVILMVIAVVACAAEPPATTGGSILYGKAGKLWVTSPDGKVQHEIPHSGTFENPSQADDGTVLAQRDIHLHRMNRQGKALNEPITTAFRISSIVPTIKGPFWPEISPDGKTVAYTYSLVAQHFDPSCNCTVSSPSLNTTYTYSDRFTDDPVATFGNARMYGPLKLYPLDEGEMTRQHDKLVFVSGELDTKTAGSRLAIYRIKGLPPAEVPTPCFYTGASGKFTSPTWSPDGRSLAWEDSAGIWVGTLGDISGKPCQITKRLLVPGGSAPDWGPAPP
jgi:hypothetical protein